MDRFVVKMMDRWNGTPKLAKRSVWYKSYRAIMSHKALSSGHARDRNSVRTTHRRPLCKDFAHEVWLIEGWPKFGLLCSYELCKVCELFANCHWNRARKHLHVAPGFAWQIAWQKKFYNQNFHVIESHFTEKLEVHTYFANACLPTSQLARSVKNLGVYMNSVGLSDFGESHRSVSLKLRWIDLHRRAQRSRSKLWFIWLCSFGHCHFGQTLQSIWRRTHRNPTPGPWCCFATVSLASCHGGNIRASW